MCRLDGIVPVSEPTPQLPHRSSLGCHSPQGRPHLHSLRAGNKGSLCLRLPGSLWYFLDSTSPELGKSSLQARVEARVSL